MTDHVEPLVGSPLSSFAARDKGRAFRAASRHSVRVRVLRVATIAGALSLVGGIVVFTVFDPLHGARGSVSIDSASLDGTKVTMANPRLSGYHKDGRPYTITAADAVQDIKAPTIFALRDLQARLTQNDKSVTTVTAATGVYNSTSETMTLTSAVRIVGGGGLEVHAQDAQVAFKTSAVVTDKPVTVAMGGNTVAADRMEIAEGGQRVTFEGNVRSTLSAQHEADAAPAPQPGGTP